MDDGIRVNLRNQAVDRPLIQQVGLDQAERSGEQGVAVHTDDLVLPSRVEGEIQSQ